MPLTVKRTLPCLYHYVDPSLNPNPTPNPNPTDPVTKLSDLTDSTVIRSAGESIAAESKSTQAVDVTNPTPAQLTILSPVKVTTAPSSGCAPITAQGQGQGQGQVQIGSTTKRKRITPTVVGVLGSNTHLLTGNMLTASPSDTNKNSSSSSGSNNNNSSSGSSSSSGFTNGKEGNEGEEGEEGNEGKACLSGEGVSHPSTDSSATSISSIPSHSPASLAQIAFPAISLPPSSTLKTTGPDGTEIKKV